MKNKLLIFISAIICIGMIILTVLNNLDYYYAKKLDLAIEAEDITAIKEILEKRPSCVNTYPQKPMEILFNTLMEERGTNYPLLIACGNDNFEIVKMLVEAGADVDCNDGRTPLSLTYCAKKDHWYQISTYLIENGASLDYVTEYSGGKSSILMDITHAKPGAALEGYVPDKEEEVLAAFNYALEHCDHSKVNWVRVLQYSVTWDRIEIVKFLLDENYCNVNDTTPSEMTALMFAARDSTVEMTQLLLDMGADKDMIDSEGKTAYDYAVEYGDDGIACRSNGELRP